MKISLKKFRAIALAACFLSLPFTAEANPHQYCKAFLDTKSGTDAETNNCPIVVGKFSIRGTFSNSNWLVSFGAWEPGYYILYIKDRKNGSTINLTGFDVIGTTNRPQYRFTDRDRGVIYILTFRYSDSNAVRVESYKNGRAIINELLGRESDKLLGGP